jgi:hypothetical protein
MRNTYRILVGKLRYRWVANIEINLREIRWGGTDGIGVVQDMDL